MLQEEPGNLFRRRGTDRKISAPSPDSDTERDSAPFIGCTVTTPETPHLRRIRSGERAACGGPHFPLASGLRGMVEFGLDKRTNVSNLTIAGSSPLGNGQTAPEGAGFTEERTCRARPGASPACSLSRRLAVPPVEQPPEARLSFAVPPLPVPFTKPSGRRRLTRE